MSEMLTRAERIADDVLAPDAQVADRADVVPARGLRALADAGLFGIAGPTTHGGSALAPGELRRIVAAIGGGCGATFFVWVQHHGVVRELSASSNDRLVAEHLGTFCAGERVAGTAFAHVRRAGPPAVRATRRPGGWTLDGLAPWATSWGIADRFAIAAESDAGELVWSLVGGADGARSGIGAIPLHLPVLASTGTVAVRFDGCRIDDDEVIAVGDVDTWRRQDRLRVAPGQPATLGVAARAVRLLREGDGDAGAAADELTAEIADAWAVDDGCLAAISECIGNDDGRTTRTAEPSIDRPANDETVITAASEHRARCLLLAQRATTALLAASGGRAMDLDQPAQRLAREAMFYTIQAQSRDGRAATLRATTGHRRRSPDRPSPRPTSYGRGR